MIITLVVTDARADADWGIGEHLQALVSGAGHQGRGDTDGGLAPASPCSHKHPCQGWKHGMASVYDILKFHDPGIQ